MSKWSDIKKKIYAWPLMQKKYSSVPNMANLPPLPTQRSNDINDTNNANGSNNTLLISGASSFGQMYMGDNWRSREIPTSMNDLIDVQTLNLRAAQLSTTTRFNNDRRSYLDSNALSIENDKLKVLVATLKERVSQMESEIAILRSRVRGERDAIKDLEI